MKAIVNVNQSWGIGKDGELLVFIPEDMKFFRTQTKGKTVIMGRKTLESFPGGRPLKGRLNIVLSRSAEKLRAEYEASLLERFKEADAEKAAAEKTAAEKTAAEKTAAEKIAAEMIAARQAATEKAAGKNDWQRDGVMQLDDAGTGLLFLDSIPALFRLPKPILQDAFVIGGAQLYGALLPYCSECLVTVNDSGRQADAFFPDLDRLSEWQLTERSEMRAHEGIHYQFTIYRRKTL